MASKLELDKGQEPLQADLAFGLQKMKRGQNPNYKIYRAT
jgi:hypothetical protein